MPRLSSGVSLSVMIDGVVTVLSVRYCLRLILWIANLPRLSSGVSLFVMIDGVVTVLGVRYCLRLNITEIRNLARQEGARHLANQNLTHL